MGELAQKSCKKVASFERACRKEETFEAGKHGVRVLQPVASGCKLEASLAQEVKNFLTISQIFSLFFDFFWIFFTFSQESPLF